MLHCCAFYEGKCPSPPKIHFLNMTIETFFTIFLLVNGISSPQARLFSTIKHFSLRLSPPRPAGQHTPAPAASRAVSSLSEPEPRPLQPGELHAVNQEASLQQRWKQEWINLVRHFQ